MNDLLSFSLGLIFAVLPIWALIFYCKRFKKLS